MKIVGLTGGMGAGKSTAAQFFKKRGCPIYIADLKAKELMCTQKELKEKLIFLLGKEAYTLEEQINKKFIAEKIFSDSELLQKHTQLVHQAVKEDFLDWFSKQDGLFCIKESAILYESGLNKDCDFTVVVTANEKLRIQRIQQREKWTKEEILTRLEYQWPQQKLIHMSDFHIVNNDDVKTLKEQVNHITDILVNLCRVKK